MWCFIRNSVELVIFLALSRWYLPCPYFLSFCGFYRLIFAVKGADKLLICLLKVINNISCNLRGDVQPVKLFWPCWFQSFPQNGDLLKSVSLRFYWSMSRDVHALNCFLVSPQFFLCGVHLFYHTILLFHHTMQFHYVISLHFASPPAHFHHCVIGVFKMHNCIQLSYCKVLSIIYSTVEEWCHWYWSWISWLHVCDLLQHSATWSPIWLPRRI